MNNAILINFNLIFLNASKLKVLVVVVVVVVVTVVTVTEVVVVVTVVTVTEVVVVLVVSRFFSKAHLYTFYPFFWF